MLVAGGDTARDQCFVALEVDQANVRAIADQDIAVVALQRGTGDDAVSARTTRLVDPGSDRAQPRPTILIGEGNTVVHLLDVGCRVEPIGVLEFPSGAKGLARPESDVDIAIALMPSRGKYDWALGDYAYLKDDWKRQLEAIVGIDVHLYHIEPGTPLDEDARRTGVLLWARDQTFPVHKYKFRLT
jgi:hypothetical protein